MNSVVGSVLRSPSRTAQTCMSTIRLPASASKFCCGSGVSINVDGFGSAILHVMWSYGMFVQ